MKHLLLALALSALAACTSITQNCSGTCTATSTTMVNGNSATVPVSALPGVP